MKRQLAYVLARAQVPYHWLQHSTTDDEGDETLEDLPEDLQEILFNSRLSAHFKQFGNELDVQDPKSLEDVYKSHLETSRTSDFVSFGRPYIYVMGKDQQQQALTQHEGILPAPLSMPLLMRVSEMTNLWLMRKRVTVGSIKTKTMVRNTD